MSEFRQNLVTQEWVIIAPERGKKPVKFKDREGQAKKLQEYDRDCPFCRNNEKKSTNIETYRIDDKAGNWLTRSIENKFKILSSENICPIEPSRFEEEGIYMKYKGCGRHEVIIENPYHNKHIAVMSRKDVSNIISVYLHRYIEFGKDRNNLTTIIFKNSGMQAGASQPHTHSQIVGSRMVPLNTRYMLIEAQRYFDRVGTCVLCEMMNYDIKESKRIIYQNNSFISLVPYAASFAHESWIIPKRHYANFGAINPEEINDFADILKTIITKFHNALDNPDYNYVIYSAPYPMAEVPFFHWYVRIVPRISTPGGFEVGTRISVNPVYPEESADILRKCKC